MNKSEILYKPRHYKSIPQWENVSDSQWNDPQWQLKNSVRDINALRKVVTLTDFQANEIKRTISELEQQGKDSLRITPYYASLMQADPFHPTMLEGEKDYKRLDPIFWQSVPTPANLLFPNTGIEGAMDEENRSYGSAYQRYPNRVALFVGPNTNCASYCNHCQRAKSLDGTAEVNLKEIKKGLFYIGYNKCIDEVLVTGGDALMINSSLLEFVLEELSKIEHLRVIRIATRVPVVLPMAITDSLLDMIKKAANKHSVGLKKYIYFMTHINHYQEITYELARAAEKILSHGFTIRNQTVLLNHVNDYFKTLAVTFRRMFWIGIHPYYLLQCHKEKGIVHFITPIQIGKIYMKHLQGWLSGIVRPNYAANVEGGGGKILLIPSGHDTLHMGNDLETRISESYANIYTWDQRKLTRYEALGRASVEEYKQAQKIMNEFIGRENVFLPKIILIDKENKPIRTTNRTKLPRFDSKKKSTLLEYPFSDNGMPLTNPYPIREQLDKLYEANNS